MSLKNYPKSPQPIPQNLVKTNTLYKVKAGLAILSVAIFFFLYGCLLTATGYLVKLAIYTDIPLTNVYGILFKLGLILGASSLVLFGLKFIFKLKNSKPKNRIKLVKKDNPEIFEYIEQICKETGAPGPKNIYFDPDVNAYVSYTNNWLSLIMPVRKELTIGMGLTNCLNNSEFKAVMAHEFGHFSQRSMRIGTYVNTANTIIHDMIFQRDYWDNFLHRWRNMDLRLSFVAWILTPIIWLFRQLLFLFYILLNRLQASLSREMEFNADKVSVSVSGSDGIISGLWKLEEGQVIWNNVLNHVFLASKKDFRVLNLYLHHNEFLNKGEEKRRQLYNELEDNPLGGKLFFAQSENSKTHMYASHPNNDLREQNAKSPYIYCEMDDRPASILFPNIVELQEKLTQLVYKEYLTENPKSEIDFDQFESFIASETYGEDLLGKYLHNFEERNIYFATNDELHHAQNQFGSNYSESYEELMQELKRIMIPIQEINKLLLETIRVSDGTSKSKTIEYNNKKYRKKELNQVYLLLQQDRENHFQVNFKKWDISFFSFALLLAKGKNTDSDFLRLFRQFEGLNSHLITFLELKSEIYAKYNQLVAQGDVEEYELNHLDTKIRTNVAKMNENLDALLPKVFVPLPNFENRDQLIEFIIPGKKIVLSDGSYATNNKLDTLFQQLESVNQNLIYLERKNTIATLVFITDLLNQYEIT